MAKFVKLTGINLETEKEYNRLVRAAQRPRVIDADLSDAEDVAVAAPTGPVTEPEGLYFPILIDVEDVREVYPRQPEEDGPRYGTRVVFKNGAARPVKEAFDDVETKVYDVSGQTSTGRVPRAA